MLRAMGVRWAIETPESMVRVIKGSRGVCDDLRTWERDLSSEVQGIHRRLSASLGFRGIYNGTMCKTRDQI